MNRTAHIAGHKLTLRTGVRYWASRPMAQRGMKVFPVTIEPQGVEAPTVTIDGLDYERANALLAAFNNGPSSFDGRIW